MLLFPNCKINLGLRIVSKRTDGYHDIETVMYPVENLCDALEILRYDCEDIEFSVSGIRIDGAVEKNICLKAYRVVQREYPQVRGVYMHLHKAIPMGAGLGGGSSDAAYVIRELSDLFGLGIDRSQMERMAAEVGSDVPFFVANRPALATGRGERLEPVDRLLAGWQLVLVKPPISVGTAEAYAGVTPRRSERLLTDILYHTPIEQWRECVVNDFEPSVFARYPIIAQIKSDLYRLGAVYASMSGSGSTVFGIFDRAKNVDLSCFQDMFVHHEVLE